MMRLTVKEQTQGKSEICLAVLESLPDWFAEPESLARYVKEVCPL